MERIPAEHKVRAEEMFKKEAVAESEDSHHQTRRLVENGTVDYLGQPADKSTTGGWLTAPLIFGGEVCERMSAFGIGYNLVTYLVADLHLSKTYSANMVTNFVGTAFLTCLIGGFVADTWQGRYLTIGIFGAIQFLGLIMITLFASLPAFWQPSCDPPEVPCQPVHGVDLAVLYLALYLLALGTGGIKACVSAFGADQFDHHDVDERRLMAYFFNWFFFFISMGALFAVTLLVYVQDKIGRGWGFGITSSCMLFAVVVFVAGRKVYRYSPPQGSPLMKVARVIIGAVKNRKLKLPSEPAIMLHEEHPVDSEEKRSPKVLDDDKIPHTNQFLFLSKAAIVPEVECAPIMTGTVVVSPDSHLEVPVKSVKSSQHRYRSLVDGVTNLLKRQKNWKAKDAVVSKAEKITVTQVEEVKVFIRMLPILFTTFLFWTVYAQMTTFSVEQAVIMDRRLGQHFEIPAASIAIFLQLSIMTMVVLYDRVLVRVLRHYTKRPHGISTLQRIGVGLVLSFLAMVAAALIEQKRHRTIHKFGFKAHISVFWLLPQYFLVGTGEAFTYIGQLEFFYSESPSSMRSMGTALCLCTMSIGFYSSGFLVDTVDRFSRFDGEYGWLADNLDLGHLDRFYWLLAFLSILNFSIYLVVARWYNYRSTPDGECFYNSDNDAHEEI